MVAQSVADILSHHVEAFGRGDRPDVPQRPMYRSCSTNKELCGFFSASIADCLCHLRR